MNKFKEYFVQDDKQIKSQECDDKVEIIKSRLEYLGYYQIKEHKNLDSVMAKDMLGRRFYFEFDEQENCLKKFSKDTKTFIKNMAKLKKLDF